MTNMMQYSVYLRMYLKDCRLTECILLSTLTRYPQIIRSEVPDLGTFTLFCALSFLKLLSYIYLKV